MNDFQNVREAACEYIQHGWQVLPVSAQSKTPVRKGWQRGGFTANDIDPAGNIGVLVGEPSGIVDVDLDCELAVELAREFLPPTGATFGHGDAPQAHWIYACADAGRTRRWQRRNGETIVELRSTGGQTIFPPSVHPSGEPIRWATEGEPTAVTWTELEAACNDLASAVLHALGERADSAKVTENLSAMADKPAKEALARPLAQDHAYLLKRATAYVNALKPSAEGGRNSQAFSAAGHLAAFTDGNGDRLNEQEIFTLVSTWNLRNTPRLDDQELAATVHSAIVNGIPREDHLPSDAAYPAADDTAITPLTDSGNGELLAALYGTQLRYDHRRRRWLVWGGHYWRDDTDGQAGRMALEVARYRQRSALSIQDRVRREAAFRFGIQSENRQRLDAMLNLARGIIPLADSGDKWDAAPLLLPCENGVVELDTGRLHPGRQDERLRTAVPHCYTPDAKCPRWEQFLAEVLPDPEVREFVSRAIGYSATGRCGEQCWFLLSGTGCNGKSTFLRVLADVLGPVAINLPFATFTVRRDNGATNDLASLVGARLVTASETGDTCTLDEARIKALSGEDLITARFLYSEFFSFRPTCKIWLSCNQRPAVRDDSYAFWRRVRCLNFPRRFEGGEIDRDLKARLFAEREGILAWIVRQAGEYLRSGLNPPPAVLIETEAYREDTDVLSDFLYERCATGEGYTAFFSDLYRAYQEWSEKNHLPKREVLSKNNFGRKLGARFEKSRRGGPAKYYGIGIIEWDRVS